MARAPGNPLLEWWSVRVVATVDHPDVVERVRAEGGWDSHYAFMLMMSAGIAVLGLLLSSPAVVIGAMLISPLMGPILGLGFAVATFDSSEIRRSALAGGLGVLAAVLFCALIVLLSPLQTVTEEIASRTRPNLFDLMVALFSGLAGSYAMIRGRHGAIVGVAIATSLMPPLATVGFGLATANGSVFWGAALLFFTNFMIIAIAAAVMARLYGFGHQLSPRQTRLQASLLFLIFLALAVPLGLSLKTIAWETLASRQAREVIAAHFGPQSRVADIAIDYDVDPILIDAEVLTPALRANSEADVAAALQPMLGVPVTVRIDQFRVGGETDAAEVELATAKARAGERQNSRIAERLALIAGVSQDQLLIDQGRRIAQVRAAVLPGAALASYRALEQRVAASEQGWSIVLVPPPAALPALSFAEGELDSQGQEALATAIWGGRRLNLGIGVSGGEDAAAEEIVALLIAGGAVAERTNGGGEIALEWLAPNAAETVP